MKKHFINLLLLLSAALCLTACSDDEVPAPKPLHANGSRSLIADGTGASTSNPRLLKNWENIRTIYIPNKNNQLQHITAPWYDGVETNLSSEFRKDIKKVDGWTMLFHTFKDAFSDIDLTYMVFYNVFTGVIKVFYYSEEIDKTNTQWVFKCSEDTKFKMFFVPSFLSKIDQNMITETGVIVSNQLNIQNTAIAKGWNGFEYKVAQYSKEDLNHDFLISAQSNLISYINYEGFLTQGITGEIKSVTVPETMGKNNASKLINSVANMGGEAGKEYITGLFNHSNGTSTGSDSEGGFSGKLLGSLKDLAGDVAKEGIGAVIKKGLGILFGQTSTVTVQKTVSDVNLTAEGSVSLQGVSTAPVASIVAPLQFNLGRILAGNNSITNNPLVSSPQFPNLTYLGVWCLVNKPVAYFDLVQPFQIEESTDLESHEPLEVRGQATYPRITCGKVSIMFNPAIQKYIKSYSVETKPFLASFAGQNYGYERFPANPDESDIVYNNYARTIYGIPTTKEIGLLCDMAANEINSGSQLFYKWHLPSKCEVLTLVTVTMNISYMGKERTITESRVFETEAREQQSFIQHNPPSTAILNHDDSGWQTWGNRAIAKDKHGQLSIKH